MKLNDIEIIKELYSGKRSVVYRGIHKNKHVIVKFLKNDYPSVEEIQASNREFQLLKNLNFPNIIRVQFIDRIQNNIVLVFEDIGGKSLQDILSEKQKIALPEFFTISMQITEGLRDIHNLNIVHRDLKPQNIIFNADTNLVQIIDFGLAKVMDRENALSIKHSLEGTMSYISPEQTGRMNRSVDYRTDFYSLGVTFYQLLSGVLPFISEDQVELIHCHMARDPNPLFEYGIPVPISNIVMKLMNKIPEDRYQSAEGILNDLIEVQNLYYNSKSSKSKNSFQNKEYQPGRNDTTSKFLIPEMLYGRGKESLKLFTAFKKITKGERKTLVLSGESGSGKTALVNEVHKPLIEYRGFFISAGFERNRSTHLKKILTDLLTDLFGQINTQRETVLQHFKSVLKSSLKENQVYISRLIPEAKFLLDSDDSITNDPEDSQYYKIVTKLIHDVSSTDHPLVIYIDDLQFADSESLTDLFRFLSFPDFKYLMTVLSIQTDSNQNQNDFKSFWEGIRSTGMEVIELPMKPLKIDDINRLTSDTLKCDWESSMQISEILYEKTGGNPRHVHLQLEDLYRKELVYFENKWKWKIEEIRRIPYSENRIQRILSSLPNLDKTTSSILFLTSCLKSDFSIDIINSLLGLKSDSIDRALNILIEEKYLLRNESNFQFIDSRLKERIYKKLTSSKRKNLHKKIAGFYKKLSESDRSNSSKYIYEIADHLKLSGKPNDGDALESYIQIQLAAREKAEASGLYKEALDYLNQAKSYLSIKPIINHETINEIYHSLIYLKFRLGDYTDAEKDYNFLQSQNLTDSERISSYTIYAGLLYRRNRFRETLDLCLQTLDLLNERIESEEEAQIIFGNFDLIIERRNTSHLVDSRFQKSDKNSEAIMEILPFAILSAQALSLSIFSQLIAKMLKYTMEKGFFPTSPLAFFFYSQILITHRDKITSGLIVSDLAQKSGIENKKGYLSQALYYFLSSKFEIISETKRYPIFSLKKSIATSKKEKDFQTFFQSINHLFINFLSRRKNFEQIQSEIEIWLDSYDIKHYPEEEILLVLQKEFIKTLSSDQGNRFDFETNLKKNENIRNVLEENIPSKFTLYYNYCRAFIELMTGDPEEALRYSDRSLQNEFIPLDILLIIEFQFLNTYLRLIIALNQWINEKDVITTKWNDSIKSGVIFIKKWSEYSSINFSHKYNLLKAGSDLISNELSGFIENLNKSLEHSKNYGFLFEEALAHEIYILFWGSKNQEQFVKAGAIEAHYAYERWGCSSKTQNMESIFPFLKRENREYRYGRNRLADPGTTGTTIASIQTSKSTFNAHKNEVLDFNSVLKASQTISGEIELGRLLSKMIRILMEVSGGDTGIFILVDRDKNHELVMHVEAENRLRSKKL
ncbi:MAG: protein kinase [Leptospiraceae bacterium]|nr:protein kinase [Leptospiraceae bacterium]MCP5513514.1 protein kinase [Leptospiraceae bacterium]